MKSTLSILMMSLILVTILRCDISSPDIFVLQQEDILGIWHGEVEVPVIDHPGTYTKRDVTATIKDRDTTEYSLGDTLDLWIQEEIAPNSYVITHQGYLVNLKIEYEATLQYEFYREHVGTTTKYDFYATQTASDSIKVQFGTYEYNVRK